MAVREASHAGSWYSDHGPTLKCQLDHWLDQVPDEIEGKGKLPVPGARVIIAPYEKLPTVVSAGVLYKQADWSEIKTCRLCLFRPLRRIRI